MDQYNELVEKISFQKLTNTYVKIDFCFVIKEYEKSLYT